MKFPILYKTSITRGIQHAKDSSIAICILARNCEKYLYKNLQRYSKLASYFKEVQFFIAENDSTDNTAKIIKQWIFNNTQNHVTYHIVNVHKYFKKCKIQLSEKNLSSEFDSSLDTHVMARRVMRIACVRDAALHEIKTQKYEPSYVLMSDADITCFSIRGILHSLGQSFIGPLPWDGITANGRAFNFTWSKIPFFHNIYHDSFALSLIHMKDKIFDWKRKLQEKISSLQKGDALFPVQSAFGGMGLYKYQSIKNASYLQSSQKDSYSFCEHISFHREMKQNSYNKIYINPNMLVYYNKAIREFFIGFFCLRVIKKYFFHKIKKS